MRIAPDFQGMHPGPQKKGGLIAKMLKVKHMEKRQQSLGQFRAIVDEIITQKKNKKGVAHMKWVVLPNGRNRLIFDGFSTLFLLYTALFTPFQLSFLGEDMTVDNISDWIFVFILDRFVDLVFFADILINFRTAWELPDGSLHFNAREGAMMYCKGWFLLDVISVLPYELLGLFIQGAGKSVGRLPKLIKLLKLAKLLKMFRASRIMRRWEQVIQIKYGVLRLVTFLISIVVISHWLACGFYLVSTVAVDDIHDPLSYTWMSAAGISGDAVWVHYCTAIYWGVMTMATIGYGDVTATNTAEKIYVTFAMIIGAGYYAYVVGVVCSLVQSLDGDKLKFQEKMDSLNEYMKSHKIPEHLRIRIRKFCFFQRDNIQVTEEYKILGHMSLSLQSEVALHNYRAILERLPHFKGARRQFISGICGAISAVVFGPNDCVLEEGQLNESSCFIIRKGRVQAEFLVKDLVETFQDAMTSGRYFGERALVSPHHAEMTFRTLTFCQMLLLDCGEIRRMLDLHPIVKKQTRKIVALMLWKFVLRSFMRKKHASNKTIEQLREQLWAGFKDKDEEQEEGGGGGGGGGKEKEEEGEEVEVIEPNTEYMVEAAQLQRQMHELEKRILQQEKIFTQFSESITNVSERSRTLELKMDSNFEVVCNHLKELSVRLQPATLGCAI